MLLEGPKTTACDGTRPAVFICRVVKAELNTSLRTIPFTFHQLIGARMTGFASLKLKSKKRAFSHPFGHLLNTELKYTNFLKDILGVLYDTAVIGESKFVLCLMWGDLMWKSNKKKISLDSLLSPLSMYWMQDSSFHSPMFCLFYKVKPVKSLINWNYSP